MAKDHGPSIKDDEQYEALRREGESKEKAARIANAGSRSSTGRKGGKAGTYEDRSKEDLLKKAHQVGIEGRSKMSKKELISALRQAIEAEDAGFDGVACSDHFQPWWEPGESGMAWVWLGAVGQATRRVSLGTAVTPALSRYHPALVAQAWATLEVMFPGRTFLGIGSGESLNESPAASTGRRRVEAMTEALELIGRLFDGEHVTHDGHFT
jgi:alkanesulfonate monooxygenase SsuD/methylene tetrahydromethanopterin reductase-like flavin-dependent oxidoreductase (luciferase family)